MTTISNNSYASAAQSQMNHSQLNHNQKSQKKHSSKSDKSEKNDSSNRSSDTNASQRSNRGGKKNSQYGNGHDNGKAKQQESTTSNHTTTNQTVIDYGSKIGGNFSQVREGTIDFSFFQPGAGDVDVSLSNTSIRLTVPLGNVEGIADNYSRESVTYELDFSDPASWTKGQTELLDSLGFAMETADLADLPIGQQVLFEKSKARLSALQDPTFWADVEQAHTDNEENVVNLNNGEQVRVNEEYFLTPVRGSNGTVTYNVFNPGDGYTTRNVRLSSDGLGATFGSTKGAISPIRIDENGKLKVVLKSEPVTDEELKNDSIASVMDERTNGVELQVIPLLNANGQTVHNNDIKPVDGGGVSLTYMREQGVSENVEITNTGITFTTLVPPSVLNGGGDTAATQKPTEIKQTLDFSKSGTWTSSDFALIDTLGEALDGINLSQITPAQETLINQATTRVDTIGDNSFWQSVASQVQPEINGTLDGEAVSIREEYKLTQVITVTPKGDREVEFFVERGDGREKVELLDDNQVKVGDDTFPVYQQDDDWMLVTKHETIDQLTSRIIGQHMKVRAGQSPVSDRQPLLNDVPAPSAYVIEPR